MKTAQTMLINGGKNLKVASPRHYSILCVSQCHSIKVLNCPTSRTRSRMSHSRWSLWLLLLTFLSAVNLNFLCTRGWLQIGYNHVTEKPTPQFQIYCRLEKHCYCLLLTWFPALYVLLKSSSLNDEIRG